MPSPALIIDHGHRQVLAPDRPFWPPGRRFSPQRLTRHRAPGARMAESARMEIPRTRSSRQKWMRPHRFLSRQPEGDSTFFQSVGSPRTTPSDPALVLTLRRLFGHPRILAPCRRGLPASVDRRRWSAVPSRWISKMRVVWQLLFTASGCD